MAKEELPGEVDDRRLSFPETLKTLRMLQGERVVVFVSGPWIEFPPPRNSAAGVARSRTMASLVGRLVCESGTRLGTPEFSFGTPYEDSEPERLAGGVLYLDEDDFVAAILNTRDGTEHFFLEVQTRALGILVRDQGSGYP